MSKNTNKVVTTVELNETAEKGSLLIYGTFRLAIPSRNLSKTFNLAASLLLGDKPELSLKLTRDTKEIVSLDDFPTPTPFQAALILILCEVLARVSIQHQTEHHVKVEFFNVDQEAFEALRAGLSVETIN